MSSLLVLAIAAIVALVFFGIVTAVDAGGGIGWFAGHTLGFVQQFGEWARSAIGGSRI